ncbi:related to polyketide synthase [Cephalotrichum gorgonifer]|uniref:Related to polyketide synthase n=1 Tax=Cephalotrichum gorgonifer TaxID=2041049 RepID=A0AAE8N5U9_9PEZI|nr:related to polyketide synthase [Cephalotrichum gorgonifer]
MAAPIPEPIAIVGSGCRFPGGASSPSKLWELIREPHDVLCEIPSDRFNTTGFFHPDGTHHATTNVRHSYLLREDVKVFDEAFFNISPNEADSIDPQQRLLLETVYEALEAGGHPMEALSGSDTAVYVGTMSADYGESALRDMNTVPTYFATGTSRAIISNRVSYFFNWHGPSMTIDTACSSSLIAVHQGVRALRSGDSRVAVACGTQVILGPEAFIYESNLRMLSPNSRSRMWDSEADGYARGEGVAAIVLKRLSDAIADNDHIECVIRETGANQDGFSSGITVPSADAQATLIRQTYRRAGLDPENNSRDRPQFFEAHGTGTKAGDPKEAAAIHRCLGVHTADEAEPLYVGSVKTVIGHTEGAAGLAGLLKASGIIQRGFIPPNLLFDRLNPDIEPFYKGLEVPTSLRPWPQLPEGVPRRVSVNSFGFGGSNAHAILEEYRPTEGAAPGTVSNNSDATTDVDASASRVSFTPFVFSAASEASLVSQLQAYSKHFVENPDIYPIDLAWTLQSRRSQLPFKVSFSAATIAELRERIDERLTSAAQQTPAGTIGTRSILVNKGTPGILGVFTGQGAQWPSMGAELIRSSEFVHQRVQELGQFLVSLPEADRPEWDLEQEMLAGADVSRVAEAALSQPLCTAIQIILVDLLRSAGVRFSAVVGHSSGEIGVAYAAGFLSDKDAIRVAYYRGLYARLAGSATPAGHEKKGAMMAVGTSCEDAQHLLGLRAFRGRLALAAHNSSASVTLSGDADAIAHAKRVFDEEKKFARVLKVDTAYHSHHMLPCGDPYVSTLKACGVRALDPRREGGNETCSWFSSVFPDGSPIVASEALEGEYWRENMQNAVRFADAVKNAVASNGQIACAIEVGPHPALKGPATQNIGEVLPNPLPYTGVLSRGKSDVHSFSDGLGFVWSHLGAGSGLDFRSYEKLVSASTYPSAPDPNPKLVVGLPSYEWNHTRRHWHESRKSRRFHGRQQPFHELLGVLCEDSTDRELRWQNVLKVSEMPWVAGHQLQDQTVFPATGYIAMAIEAARILAGDREVDVFELQDFSIPRAIAFEDDSAAGVETLVTLTDITATATVGMDDGETVANFLVYSCPVSTGAGATTEQEMKVTASGRVKIVFGKASTDALSSTPPRDSAMIDVDADRFYDTLSKLGYGYYESFRGMTCLKRRHNLSSAVIDSYVYEQQPTSSFTRYLVHPTWLDVAIQSSLLAFSMPGDHRLWSLHVPTAIRSIRVSPAVCASLPAHSLAKFPVWSSLVDSEKFSASIDVFGEDGTSTMIQVEDLEISPFAPATAADDRRLFSYTKLEVAAPDGASVLGGDRPTEDEADLAILCERVSFYYIKKWKAELTDEDWAKGQSHHPALRNYVDHVLDLVTQGRHPTIKGEWASDTSEHIRVMASGYPSSVDLAIISAVGENIPAAVRGDTTILEHMLANNLLDNYYKGALGFSAYNTFLARMMEQLVHRYPNGRILEVGAGTGGATRGVLRSIGHKMDSYTYTDISTGFLGRAAEAFEEWADKMTFKTLDIERPPATQGYQPHSYDIVVASNVLHATSSMQRTLEHTRQLLRPGGYLVLLEITNNDFVRGGSVMGGLTGWWLGVEDGRTFAPTMTPGQWHTSLRKAGFGGVDAITPAVDPLTWPLSIMASQAVDDQVNFLRKPLAGASAVPVHLGSVVVLGGTSVEGARVAEEIMENLARYCGSVTVLPGLPTEEEAADLTPMSTVINLVDVDISPIFKNMTAEKLEGLKRVYGTAGALVWITRNAQVDEPYHMASIAFSRTLHYEAGHVNMSHLDVPDLGPGVARSIAEHVLRQFALGEWDGRGGYGGEQRGELLWSKEPESYLDRGGQIKIPRLVNNLHQNARLNSAQRAIDNMVSLESCPNVVLSISDNSFSSRSGYSCALVDQVPPDRGAAPPGGARGGGDRVKLVASTVQATLVAADTFLVVGIGRDVEKNLVVTLSDINSPKITPIARVPLGSTWPVDNLLVRIAAELTGCALIQAVSPGSSILVHASVEDRFLASSLSRRAATVESVRLTLTYDTRAFVNETVPGSWIGLSARAATHIIRDAVRRAKPTHFLDLTATLTRAPSELGARISHVLPSNIRRIHHSDICRCQPSSLSETEGLPALLQSSVTAVMAQGGEAKNAAVRDLVVQIDQIHDPSLTIHARSVVRWSRDSVENDDDVKVRVGVRRVDAQRLFSKNKTYLLVGLTGEIGRSLCEWMVANGAGCVWLTSRSPKIDQGWLESLQATHDSTIRVASLHVTDKGAIERLVAEIRATCPPIAGVANGAMVLRDCLFSEMPIDDLQTVLGPKIDGSRNLDEVFHNDDLDFFVLLSSSAQVIGNMGQSNYTAANGYLTTLARKRRRRGLAASALDIGRVAGIGYIETARQAVVDQVSRLGLMPISEPDFRQTFAEAILAGYPMPGDTEGGKIPAAVVTTGISTVRDNEDVMNPWLDNPVFSHCIAKPSAVKLAEAGTSKKVALPVAQQLAGAASKEEALEILQECFSAKVKVMLQISDRPVDPETALVELGVDSLIAVEVRSWFLKELQVDVPVLKVVGGASLAELCQRAMDKLPAFSVDGGDLGKPALKQAPEAGVYSHPPPPASNPRTTSTAVAIPSPFDGLVGPFSQAAQVLVPLTADPESASASAPASTPVDELSSRPGSLDGALATTPNTEMTPLAPSDADTAAESQSPERKFLRTEQISFGQSRFWFLQLLLEDPLASNVSFYIKVTGTLRIGDLERAVRVVMSRHEALRTAFVVDETHSDQAYQKVLDKSLIWLDVRSAGSAEEASAVYHDLRQHAFDLGSGELIRLLLVSVSPTLHYFMFHYHHIAMDGISFQVLVRDLEKAYRFQSLGPAPRQFPDYSRAQREAYRAGDMNRELDYWRTIFPAGQEPPVLPLLPMASTSSRVAMKDFSVHQVMQRIEPALMARIKAVSKSNRSTPFHFYLAAFKTMLFKFADTNDLTIGIADANRTDSDIMGSIGFFLNLLALRFRRLDSQPFSDAVSEARTTAYGALGNSRLPFDVLLEELNVARFSTHSPFFQAFFDYRQGAQEKFSWGDTQFEIEEANMGRTAYDMTLDVTDNARDSLVIFRVQRGLYDLTAAGLLLETYIHLLDVLSSEPTLPLESTPVFSKAQLSRATEIGRGPKLVSSWPPTLPLRIDEVARRVPGDVALKDGHGASLRYSDLMDRVESIAEALAQAGVGSGGRVPVFQDAAADWLCSMLAIMRVGGIYVPLDLRNPLPRLAAVVADCEPVTILVDSTTRSDVGQINATDVTVIDVSRLASKPSKPVPNVSTGDSPAAILYTSGSTGTPKGIVVTHRGLRNEIEGYTRTWKLGAERTLQQSAFTFNHSMDQIYTGLSNGGMVYIVPWSERGDPLQVTRIVREESITYTKATPAEYSLWLQYGGDNLRLADKWRAAFGGGESMDRALTRGFAGLGLRQLRLHNSYGPTEISISSTKMELDYRNSAAMEADGGRIPCGFSLPNYHAYIVDEKLRPLPAGMAGELCIGGAGVSLGYLRNKDLTDQYFVHNPFATADDTENGWTRMYRTGDICHFRHDGALVFHSRMAGDTQVKIRGLRIELNDIESNIVATSEGVIKEAVATLREGDPDFLVAHVVLAQQPPGNTETYLANLLSRLPVPQYMVPVVAISLERLPLTNHCKVDRRAIKELPLPQNVRVGGGSHEENDDDEELTETMVRLRGVWLDVLKNKHVEFDISPSSSFFLVGGNSLLAIRLQSRIRDVFNVTVRLVDLLHSNKLGEMSHKIDESVRVDHIDWDHETKPPSLPDFLLTNSPKGFERKEKKTVLLTGSTGFLAKYILSQLLANPAVDAIHHVAVRDPSKLRQTASTTSSAPKVVTHTGDLTAPLLGLSEAEFSHLASTVDVILHLGAARSFWDNYRVLRPVNVLATAELVKIAAPRRAHIHYISTFGVLPQDGDHFASPSSAAANVPASDGSSNGYVATKWASERILERSADELGVPATIYRFLPASQSTEATPGDVLDEFVRFVDIVGAAPDMTGWRGRIDMIPAAQAAAWLLDSASNTASDENGRVKFVHAESTAVVNVENLRNAMEEERSRHGRGNTMPGLRWLGRIKQFGFNYLFTSQQAKIQETGASGKSSEFESRR